jgi:4-hydroxybenzoate polyprenyltransferase
MNNSLANRFKLTLKLIRFSHTIFALPFALLGAVLAAGEWPDWRQLRWIVLACIFARSSAMAFNSWTDQRFDALNPRTENWPLASNQLNRGFVLCFWISCSACFIFSSAMLNKLAFYLSPICLIILLGYSLTKRFTKHTHFFLGTALGLAPVGAWIGVRGSLDPLPFMLGLGVLAWVAGFDIIYSCQDTGFDRQHGLHSLPSRLGVRKALAVSALCHLWAVIIFMATGIAAGLGIYYYTAIALTSVLLVYQQSIITPVDLSRLNRAFLTVNGWISVIIFLGGWMDVRSMNPF